MTKRKSGEMEPKEGSNREQRLESLMAAFLVVNGFDNEGIDEMSKCGCMSCRIIVTMYSEVKDRIMAETRMMH